MISVSDNRLYKWIKASSFLRFLVSGGANTALTYAIYLVMLQVATYRISYTVAYILGIIFSFFVNRFFVFQTHRGWRSVALFPLVYIVQYITSLVLLWVWIDHYHLPKEIGPLVAIVITIPITFGLSRVIFGPKRISKFHGD